jgi:phosphonate transport system substrate-binding protein
MFRPFFFLLLLLMQAGVAVSATGSADDDRVYRWSVVPQFSPVVVHRDWTPLLAELSRRTGLRFKLEPAGGFDEFERSLYQGAYDFVYANPYQTLLANRKQGYRPLVRDEQRRLTGILVVHRNSPYRSPRDLDGKTIAFASPNAFAVSLYMRAMLKQREGIDFTPLWSGTHSNAYRQVLLGRADASGGIYRTLEKEPESIQQLLRVVYRLPGTITHAVAAHPRVPQSLRRQVQQALLELAQSERGRRLLSPVFLPQPIAADFDRDYLPLERLNLDDLVVMPR